MEIGPQNPPAHFLHGVQHVVVIVPINAHVDEAQHITQEIGDQGLERIRGFAVRHLELQHHDGDDDGDDAIAESFEPGAVHSLAVRIGFSLASAMLPVNCNRRGISMRGLMLSLGLVATMSAWGSPAPPLPPPRDLQLARDMLKSLVEINTTHAHGSTEAAK